MVKKKVVRHMWKRDIEKFQSATIIIANKNASPIDQEPC